MGRDPAVPTGKHVQHMQYPYSVFGMNPVIKDDLFIAKRDLICPGAYDEKYVSQLSLAESS